MLRKLFKKSRHRWELLTNHWKVPEHAIIHHFEEVVYKEKTSRRK